MNNPNIKKPRGVGRRWRPGTSGNPGGRPKYSLLSHALRDRLASLVPGTDLTYADAFSEILCNAGLRGDKQAIEMILQRTEGYPRAAVDMKDTSRMDLDAMTPDEIDEAILAILDEAEARVIAAGVEPEGDTELVSDEGSGPLLPPAPTES